MRRKCEERVCEKKSVNILAVKEKRSINNKKCVRAVVHVNACTDRGVLKLRNFLVLGLLGLGGFFGLLLLLLRLRLGLGLRGSLLLGGFSFGGFLKLWRFSFV